MVDLGCGPGRFTKHLAEEFQQVIGFYVSEAMLEAAGQLVGAENVRFLATDGSSIPLESGTADAILSVLMLLHLDGAGAVSSAIREVERVLCEGGTALLQIPVVVWPGDGASSIGHTQLHAARNLWRTLKSTLHRLRGEPAMQWHDYDARWLFRECAEAGLTDLRVAVVPHRSSLRSLLLVRKPRATGPRS